MIVFMDTENKELDPEYAEKLIGEFRRKTNWKVEPGTRIHNELTEWSKGYSNIKRDVSEVCFIFCMAHGLTGTSGYFQRKEERTNG
jgi:hypothetical protein